MLSGGAWVEKSNHKMVSAGDLGADAERFRELRTGEQVLDFLEEHLRIFGATHFLASGVPLPGRSIEPLILRVRWGEPREDRPPEEAVSAADPILALALRAPRAQLIVSTTGDIAERSELYRLAIADGADTLVCVPIRAFLPFQGFVLGAGRDMPIDRQSLIMLDYSCEEAFRRLLVLRALTPERPGDLSGRERRVVSLSAEGKTASDIAKLLAISQRTVHAHLQNASEKLRARNKTQTVMEALRYGQITL
jgi:DNA-binding CsgD family transcriptional regulator